MVCNYNYSRGKLELIKIKIHQGKLVVRSMTNVLINAKLVKSQTDLFCVGIKGTVHPQLKMLFQTYIA